MNFAFLCFQGRIHALWVSHFWWINNYFFFITTNNQIVFLLKISGENVAMGKSSLQSSTLWNYNPELAVGKKPYISFGSWPYWVRWFHGKINFQFQKWIFSFSFSDSDPDTCSFTPRSSEQRWWQVHLGDALNVQAVAISITPGAFQKFTIFIIGISILKLGW